MVKVDFSNVDDTRDYASVPVGEYECRVAEVREREARDGSTRWGLRLEIVSGIYAGRTAAWDSLTFSERGLGRVKHVLATLGLDVDGLDEVQPNEIVGARARVVLEEEEYEASDGGRVRSLRVPYRGWSAPTANGAETAPSGEAEVDGGGAGEHALARGLLDDNPF